MPSTLNYGISYPLGTVAPNVPVVMQQQAESVDAALTLAGLSKLPKGQIARTYDQVKSTGLAGTGVMCNLAQVDLVAGRWYEVQYTFNVVSMTAASMAVAVVFKKSATSDTTANGTDLDEACVVYTAPQAGNGRSLEVTRRWQAATTETVNIKAVLARATTTASYDVEKRRLHITDLGAL